MQKLASCNIKYSFKSSVLTITFHLLVVYVHCVFMPWKVIIQPQMNVSDSERDRRGNMAPVEHWLSDDFSLEPNKYEYPAQTQVLRSACLLQVVVVDKGGRRKGTHLQCPGAVTCKLLLLCHQMRAREDKRGAPVVALCQMIHSHLLQ